MIETIIWFSKAIAAYVLNIKTNEKLYYSGLCLLNKRTFSLPDYSQHDKIIVIRVLFNTIKQIFLTIHPDFSSVENTERMVYDSSKSNKTLRIDYLNYCKNYNVELFVSRDMLFFEKGIYKIYISFCLFLFAIPIFFWSIFSNKRTQLAALLFELVQTKNLLVIIKKKKIKIVHWFCIYENDANLGALLYQTHGVKIIKHASPSPLVVQNKIIIADTLAIESAYQKDEVACFQKTMFIKETENYFPERSHTYLTVYHNNKIDCSDPVIAFYSHGGWVRKKLNSEKALLGKLDSELELLNVLSEYCSENNIKIVIYPHPKEKKKDFLDETISFYREKFKHCQYECIISPQRNTSNEFHKVNLAISTVSTVLFERLFCGYKSLFFTKGLNDFPVRDSTLSKICANNKNMLAELIQKNLFVSTNEFFIQNNITNYKMSF